MLAKPWQEAVRVVSQLLSLWKVQSANKQSELQAMPQFTETGAVAPAFGKQELCQNLDIHGKQNVPSHHHTCKAKFTWRSTLKCLPTVTHNEPSGVGVEPSVSS